MACFEIPLFIPTLPTLAEVLSSSRQQRGVLGSVCHGRTLHGGTDGGRSGNALSEFSRMEPTGRLRLVFPGYHTRLLDRQSIGPGRTPGTGRRQLDGGNGLAGCGYNMAIVEAQASSPPTSGLGEATCEE